MDRLADLSVRLERATLQIKALQRTARTTLQVTADLSSFVDEIREEIAHSQEGIAYGNHGNKSAVGS